MYARLQGGSTEFNNGLPFIHCCSFCACDGLLTMGPSHVFPDAIDSARNDLILFPIAAGYNHRPEDEIKHRRLGYCDQQRRVGQRKAATARPTSHTPSAQPVDRAC